MAFLLKGIPAAVLLFVGLALWDTWVRRRRGEREQHPLPWLGLFALLLVLEPLEKVAGLFPGGVTGALAWAALAHAARVRKRERSHPEALLLAFCTPGSIAVAGGVAATAVALYVYALGILEEPSFWLEKGAWKLAVYPFIAGAVMAWLRRAIRRRWPQPVWVPYTYQRGMGGEGRWAEGLGLWMDETLLPLAATPFLAYALGHINIGWLSLFMFTLVGPTLVAYILWTFFNRFFLMRLGNVVERTEMIYLAFEALISHPRIARWVGELVLEWEEGMFRVRGAVPEAPDRAVIKETLERLGAPADVAGVSVDPNLLPNPWLERALARSGRGPRAS